MTEQTEKQTEEKIEQNEVFILVWEDRGKQLEIIQPVVAGRDKSCNIILTQDKVSRRHVLFKPASDGILVEDLGSTNGTYINRKIILRPTIAQVGDSITVGKAKFTVQSGLETDLRTVQKEITANITKEITKDKSLNPKATPELKSAAKEKKPANLPTSWVLSSQQAVSGTVILGKQQRAKLAQYYSNAELSAVDVPTLTGITEPINGMMFKLADTSKTVWEIGRSRKNDIVIEHESVSGNHAQLIHQDRYWRLVDLVSGNGTYVNNKKSINAYLSHKDILCFGQVECSFQLPDSQLQSSKDQSSAKIPSDSNTKKYIGWIIAALVIVLLSLTMAGIWLDWF